MAIWHKGTELPEHDEVPAIVICSGKLAENAEARHAWELAEYWDDEGWILEEWPDAKVDIEYWATLEDLENILMDEHPDYTEVLSDG